MIPVTEWTREYFLANQESCLHKLAALSPQEKIALSQNLSRLEKGKIVFLANGLIADILEPELYCKTVVIKSSDNTTRTESGKYSDKFQLKDDEKVVPEENGNEIENLAESWRWVVAQSPSTNDWVLEDAEGDDRSNKRKLEEPKEGLESFVVKVSLDLGLKEASTQNSSHFSCTTPWTCQSTAWLKSLDSCLCRLAQKNQSTRTTSASFKVFRRSPFTQLPSDKSSTALRSHST